LPHLWPTCSSGISPIRLQPDTSPQTLRIPDRSGHPVLRDTPSNWLQVRLGCFRLSPACPFRLLHTLLLSRPARHYPRFWIQRPSSERRGDFNPHDSCAAQRTLSVSLTSTRSSDPSHLFGLAGPTGLRLNRMDLPCSRCFLWLHAGGMNPGSASDRSRCRGLWFRLPL
jgi:hypothetical protein